MAYTMVAERDNQRFRKERSSALIALANARVWESEGWQVVITDAEGKEFAPAQFAESLGPTLLTHFAAPLQRPEQVEWLSLAELEEPADIAPEEVSFDGDAFEQAVEEDALSEDAVLEQVPFADETPEGEPAASEPDADWDEEAEADEVETADRAAPVEAA